MYFKSVLNFDYVYDETETNQFVLTSLKVILTFLSRATSPFGFTFLG